MNEPAPSDRRLRMPDRLRSPSGLVIAVVLLVVAMWALDLGWHSADLILRVRYYRSVWKSGAWLDPRGSRLGDDLAAFESDLRVLRRDLAPAWALGSRFGSPAMRAAPALLDAGIELAGAGTLASGIAEQMVTILATEGGVVSAGDRLQEAFSVLTGHPAELAMAAQRVERAQDALDTVPVTGLDSRTYDAVVQLDRALPLVALGLRLAHRAPALLGFDGPRHYLILAQNNDELRATGGFIAGVGLLTLEDGQIADLSFSDSYAVDNFDKSHPLAPESMKRMMGIELWVVRDANWSPDFPAGGRTAAELYGTDHEVAIDGVIAIDMIVLQELVEAVGPLRLDGYPEVATGGNLIDLMRYYWGPLSMGFTLEQWQNLPWEEKARLWFPRRKDFVQKLTQSLLQRLFAGVSGYNLPAIGSAALRSLDQRHLLVFLFDEEAQQVFADQHWDGAVLSTIGDYLQVVNANIGYNKANAKIDQTTEYLVKVHADGSAEGQVTLRYHHAAPPSDKPCEQRPRYDPTYEQMMQRCYWDYVRLYVPAGSRLLGVEGLQDGAVAGKEAGKTVLEGSFVLQPGHEQTVVFRYALPSGIIQEEDGALHYRLIWQKQSGERETPFELQVEAPDGYHLRNALPAPHSVDAGRFSFLGRLSTDQTFELTLGPGE